jgi:hypothetical protein
MYQLTPVTKMTCHNIPTHFYNRNTCCLLHVLAHYCNHSDNSLHVPIDSCNQDDCCHYVPAHFYNQNNDVCSMYPLTIITKVTGLLNVCTLSCDQGYIFPMYLLGPKTKMTGVLSLTKVGSCLCHIPTQSLQAKWPRSSPCTLLLL